MKHIEQLYQQYKHDLYHYLLSLTRNPPLAEDLLSETFISAIKSIDGYRGQSSLRTWLFAIARHKWLDDMKKRKRTVEYSDLLQLYVSGSLEGQYISKELAEKVVALLAEKDERSRLIAEMRIEGYSYAEIATRVKVSESTARVIDFRVKKGLKERLAKEGWL